MAATTAEFRMRELNAAWEVLRDPKRRAAYDRTLGLGTAADASTDSVSGGDPPRQAAPEPLLAPALERAGASRGSAWWWLGPLVALGLIVIGAVAVAVLQAGDEEQGGIEVQVGARYEPGMCVAVRPGPVAQIVSCDGPSSGRIVEVQPYPRPCNDGSLRAVALPAEDTTLCLEEVDEG